MNFDATKPVLMHVDDSFPENFSLVCQNDRNIVVLTNAKDAPKEKSITVYSGLVKESSPLNLGNLFGFAALACAFVAGRKSSSDFTWRDLLKSTEVRKYLGYATVCLFASRYFSSAQTKPVDINREPNSQCGHTARNNLELLVKLYQTKQEAQRAAIAQQHKDAFGLAITGTPLLTTSTTTTTTTIVSMNPSAEPVATQAKKV